MRGIFASSHQAPCSFSGQLTSVPSLLFPFGLCASGTTGTYLVLRTESSTAFGSWWVCPRIVENSGIFLEGAIQTRVASHPRATPDPLPGGWLCQYQITWLGHPRSHRSRFGPKRSNASYVCCHSDGISIEQREVSIEMMRKVDRFLGSHAF